MSGLGAPELIIILVVVMLLFGASRLPKLARSLGEASKEFRDAVKDPNKDAKDLKDDVSGSSASSLKDEKPTA